MKRYSLILAFISFFAFEKIHAIGKILEDHQRYNTVYIDPSNTIWLGGKTGLFEWKNQSMQRINLATALNITSIISLNEYLLIGCADGTIFTFNPSNNELNKVGNLHSEISTFNFYKNKLLIGTKGNGYLEISSYSFTHFTTKNGLIDPFIYHLQIFKDEIWTATDKGIQITSSDLHTRSFHLNDSLPDRLITSFDIYEPYLICGTQRGDLCKIDMRNDSIQLLDQTIWNGSQINDIRILDRSIAIATDHGAYLLDSTGGLNEEILSSKDVKQIKFDHEANLYFCGDLLFATSLGEQVSIARSIQGKLVPNIHTIIVDSDLNFYFTPDQGLVKYNASKHQYQQSSLPFNQQNIDITSLYLDIYGKLWVGTSGKGLYIVDTSNLHFQSIKIDSSAEALDILSITGNKDHVWVSSLNGVWYCNFQDDQYLFKSLEDEFHQKKYYVYQVRQDQNKNTWLATDGQGILKLSNGNFSNFTKDHHVSSPVFYGVEEDASGQMWFNAYNEGLYCLKKDSLVHLNQRNGLSSNEILCMMKYQQDYLIAGTSNGIDIINIHDLRVTHLDLESMHITQIPETNSITCDKNNNVYIGTNIGIMTLYLPSYKTQFVPQANIEGISVMEKCCAKSRHTFDADENYFRFKIRANYNSNQTIFFRYKLKGLNDQWNHTVDKEVVFPRLNPGKYEFTLECANNKNFFNSTSDSYSFMIENPFYRKSWFILLLLIGFAIAFYYYVRFREKRISRVEILEKEKVIAEFETLKHQVSPHFLFNSFNTLIQVIDEDKEQAIEYTQMLSDYYRSLLSYRNVDLVTFTEELILLDKYIYLQQMRFGDALHFENQCKEKPTCDIQIPPLTLQLLAENAIKHNTVSSSKPLHIVIRIQDNYIQVINNLNEKIATEAGEHIGLQNIKNRFKLFTRSNVEINKTDSEFIVSLPILTN